MNASVRPLSRSEGADAVLAEIVEEVTNKFHAGEAVDVEVYIRAHPELAAQLRQLLPALHVLADLGHSAASGDVVAVAPVPVPAAEMGELGDFRIVREIGRGGMGVVYEAVQISLSRRVALKVLPFAATLDAKQLQRFKNEAQAAAHMHHTNIVPVFGVGCERGVHYYAMQFIEGQTLAATIRELRQLAGLATAQPVDSVPPAKAAAPAAATQPVAVLATERSTKDPAYLRTVAQLGVQAAEALEYAHTQGIIHRDVKPANLLVDAQGNLWITDFGLAHCQSQPGLTMTGDVLGTLRYMSPEQALAKRVAVDARTDIYSLGATLYELLTLQPAYNGRNREEVLRQIAFEEPRLPSGWNKAVPAELETIVLKAMTKIPEERYATAQELADDLERYLKDEPIRARRPTLVQRLKKWTRRHLSVVWTAGLSFMAMLLLAVIGLTASTVLVMREKAQTEREKAQTDAAKEELERTLYYQRIALAQLEWSTNNLGRVEQLLDACRAELRGWEWHYLKRLRLGNIPPLRHDAQVLGAAFSPDGRWVASGSADGKVAVWDATAGKKLVAFPAHKSLVWSVAFSPDGRLLATASWDKTVKVWGFDPPPAAGEPPMIHALPHQQRVRSVAFSPDSKRLASAGDDKTVRVWDVASGGLIFPPLGGHTAGLWCVAYSPDGQYVVSASQDTTVKIWDASTGRELRTLRKHSQPVLCVTFSRDGKQLASATTDFNSMADGELKVWDAQTGMETLSLRGHVGRVTGVAFNPDGRRLASAGQDSYVKLWDLTTGQEVLTLRGHSDLVRSVAFSRDGNRIVSASGDRDVRVWNATTFDGDARQEVLTLRGHDGGVRSVAFSPDGRHLASAGDDATVRIWDFRRGLAGVADPLIQTLAGGNALHLNVAFSKDGQLLASGGGGGPQGGWLKVWDATTWKERLTNTTTAPPVAFSPDGQHLAAVSPDFNIEIWDIRDTATGRKIGAHLKGHIWAIPALVFSPDPAFARLASASVDGTVLIWDVTAGRKIISLPHTARVPAVAFNRDGRRLASGSRDRTVRVWDAKTGHLLEQLPDPTGGVESVAFHPKDDRVLAWGSTDSTVKVVKDWHGPTKEIRTLHGHTKWVESVAFSPDGEWIASASLDGTVKLWQMPFVPEASGPEAGASGLAPQGRKSLAGGANQERTPAHRAD